LLKRKLETGIFTVSKIFGICSGKLIIMEIIFFLHLKREFSVLTINFKYAILDLLAEISEY
jgi:hypothetical protein